MRKRSVLVALLVSTLLAACTITDNSLTEGPANPTVEPTVVEVVGDIQPDPTSQETSEAKELLRGQE